MLEENTNIDLVVKYFIAIPGIILLFYFWLNAVGSHSLQVER